MTTQTAFSVKNYTDAERAGEHPQLNDIWVFISADQVSYVIARKSYNHLFGLRMVEHKEPVFFKDPRELKAALEALQVQKEYHSMRVVISNEKHIFVPEPLFVGEKAGSYLDISFTQASQQRVMVNRLPQKDLVSVFSVEPEVADLIRQLFPEAIFMHRNELLLDIMFSLWSKDEKEKLFLFVSKHNIELGYIRNSALTFFNAFPFEADTDIVYFVLSVIESLKLNPDRLMVSICGDVNLNGTLPPLIKKYIPNFEWLKRPDIFEYPASFREFSAHQHFPEICSLLCAS